MANVLVLNSGSSSLKYQVFAMPDGTLLAWGMAERIGLGDSLLVQEWGDPLRSLPRQQVDLADHLAALARVLDDLQSAGLAWDVVGHRVVHGGRHFREPTLITNDVLTTLEDTAPLAPLHAPANLAGIRACLERYPGIPQVAVFDTAFHASLPEHAARYAIPDAWHRQWGVRRYGFHGISHGYLTERAAHLLQRNQEDVHLVLLHLGHGASISAVARGRCVETSMGLSPAEGLVMATRSGDVDPTLAAHLERLAGLDSIQVADALNRDSGLKGLCGLADMRQVLAARAKGDAAAGLAFDVYIHRIRKYLGAYLAILGRADAIVFSGGVGEHAPDIRAAVCQNLEELFGIALDAQLNTTMVGLEGAIHRTPSRIPVWVIPTREEWTIARDTWAMLDQTLPQEGAGTSMT